MSTKLDELAEQAAQEYVDAWTKNQIAFYNGETLIMGTHFIPGFKAGYNACESKLSEANEMISRLEKGLEHYAYQGYTTKSIEGGKTAREILAELNKWRDGK